MKIMSLSEKVKTENRRARGEVWHQWFAWRPVRLGENDVRWLETVERRGSYFSEPWLNFWLFWDYRPRSHPSIKEEGE